MNLFSKTTPQGSPIVSQSVLADLLGCDRTTIKSYQDHGMPFIKGGQGKKNEHALPVAVSWLCGWKNVRRLDLKISDPRVVTLFGHSIPFLKDEDHADEWRQCAKTLCDDMDCSKDAERLIGIVEGFRLAMRTT